MHNFQGQIMRKKICVLLLVLMAEQGAQAATAAYATTPYFTGQRPIVGGNYPNPAVNPQTNATTAVGDLIAQNQVKNGFAANDPRISTTLQNAGLSIVGGVAGAAAGVAVTSLCLGGTLGLGSFGCAALGLVVNAGVGVGVTYALGSLLGWVFNGDGTVNQTPVTSTTVLTTGGGYFQSCAPNAPTYVSDAYSCILYQLAYTGQAASVAAQHPTWTFGYYSIVGNNTNYCWSSGGVPQVCINASYISTGSPVSCPAGQSYTGSSCVANPTAVSGLPSPASSSTPVASAVAALTPAQQAMPLDANTLAAVANAALAASQNVPGSLPAVASNPITAADAQAEISALGANAPTVGDLFSAIQSGQVSNAASAFTPASALAAQNATSPLSGSASAVAPSTSSVTAASPSTAPATNVNLGTDPAIGSPPLDQTPDGPTIMAPLTTGLSSYTGFSVAMPQGVCPAPTFDFHPVWPVTVHSTEICTMYDSISGKIAVVMTLAWALLFLLIILKA
jgi:hypothetical protein